MLQSNFPAIKVMKHSLLREAVALSSARLQEQVRITSARSHILLIALGARWIRWNWASSSPLSMKQPGAVGKLLPLPTPGKLALNWCLWDIKSSKVLAFSHPSPAGLGVLVGWAFSQCPEHPRECRSHPGPHALCSGWLLDAAICSSYPFQLWPPSWAVASLHGLNKATSPLPRDQVNAQSDSFKHWKWKGLWMKWNLTEHPLRSQLSSTRLGVAHPKALSSSSSSQHLPQRSVRQSPPVSWLGATRSPWDADCWVWQGVSGEDCTCLLCCFPWGVPLATFRDGILS